MTCVISSRGNIVKSLRYFSTSASALRKKYCRGHTKRQIGYTRPPAAHRTDLVESRHASQSRIQPQSVACALSKFLSRAGCEQRYRQAESWILSRGLWKSRCCRRRCLGTLDEIDTRNDVSPLVRPPDLDLTPVIVVQLSEIKSLQKLISKLGERDTGLGGETVFDTDWIKRQPKCAQEQEEVHGSPVSSQHRVYSRVLSNTSQKVQ